MPCKITCRIDEFYQDTVLIDTNELQKLYYLFYESKNYDLFCEMMDEFYRYLNDICEICFKEFQYEEMSKYTIHKLESHINRGAGRLINPITKLYHILGIRSIQESKAMDLYE
jgi:hypothetical protein